MKKVIRNSEYGVAFIPETLEEFLNDDIKVAQARLNSYRDELQETQANVAIWEARLSFLQILRNHPYTEVLFKDSSNC